jgi:ATP-dependent DNA ligase
MIDINILQPSFQEYRYGTVENNQYTQITFAYKKNIASRYRSLLIQDAQNIHSSEYYIVTEKIDGHFYMLFWENDHCFLINPRGKVRYGLPVLKEIEQILKSHSITNATFACEVYADVPRPRSFDVTKILDAPNNEKDLEKIKISVFDIYQLQEKKYFEPAKVLYEQLNHFFSKGKLVNIPKHKKIESRSEIQNYFEEWVIKEGKEGLVIRSADHFAYKIKPYHTLDAVVIGYAESDKVEGEIRDLLVALRLEDGQFLPFAKVGTGFTSDDRKWFYENLKSKHVDSEYIEPSKSGVAIQFVKPEIVIEIGFLDAITETSEGSYIFKPLLQYVESFGFTLQGRMPAFSIINPVFERIRTDKTPNPLDVRLAQITDWLELPSLESRNLKLNKSQLLEREVYVKETKGMKSVRKFLLWKTNKEESGIYPAYVATFTDYSPGRADELKIEVKVSNDKAQIQQIYQEFIQENVKKGWNKV